MGNKIRIFIVLVGVLFLGLPANVLAQTPDTVVSESSILITEIKLGGKVDGESTEFINIYNDGPEVAKLDGWFLDYAKPLAKITDCDANSWKLQDDSSNVKEYQLSGEVKSKETKQIEISLTDSSGGSLRLRSEDVIYDLVGWGNSISQGVCKEQGLAPLPVNGKSIKRLKYIENEEIKYIDTNNNQLDFTDDEKALTNDNSTADDIASSNGLNDDPLAENCHGVYLSEILPNPAGEDSGNEYIELYNSTGGPVNVDGCKLKIGSSIKNLEGIIESGYTVFTGLVLPNTSGGTVEFITNTAEEAVMYPANLGDNQAWALIDGVWQLTDLPTPGSANVLSVKVEEAVNDETKNALSATEPCPAGKFRNPATNRCKNIEVEAELKPCSDNQIRNLVTNRCNNKVQLASALKPCQADQERNPETNRCRKVSLAVALASCKEGQERNPDTNRCRKVAAASTTNPNDALQQEIKSKQSISYGIFGAMAVLVLAYGIYEYRTNISNFLIKLKK